MSDESACQSCGVPWSEHAGIAVACEELAMYRKLYEHALSHVDRVFQRCTENPEPILPDFGILGESKFKSVVRLAEEYKRTCAELQRLRVAFDETVADCATQVEVAREARDAAENTAKEAVQAEMAELRKQHADLKTSLHAFASCVLSVQRHNTDDWMDWIAGTVNDVCQMLGTDDRFQYDGRERLKRVK